MIALGGPLLAPSLIDAEVLHVLRRYAFAGFISSASADRAIGELKGLDMTRYPHRDLIERVWALRHNLTAYDATYVALAEALDAPLITCDARLAAAPGHTARIERV